MNKWLYILFWFKFWFIKRHRTWKSIKNWMRRKALKQFFYLFSPEILWKFPKLRKPKLVWFSTTEFYYVNIKGKRETNKKSNSQLSNFLHHLSIAINIRSLRLNKRIATLFSSRTELGGPPALNIQLSFKSYYLYAKDEKK